jgi:uncharacterized membrane protein YhaH (DUF805 family)
MGAFSELFGFEGRIHRLGYIWRSLVAGLAVAALAFGGDALIAAAIRPRAGQAGADAAQHGLIVLVTLMALWAGFALSTRRLRDMGLEPAHIVPAYAALWVVNAVLLAPLAHTRPAELGMLENAWQGLQLLAGLPLLFWPGRPPPELKPAEFARVEPTAYMNWRETA